MMEEALGTFAKFEEMSKGTEFDNNLDEFIQKQLASGKSEEQILDDVVNGMKGEFNP